MKWVFLALLIAAIPLLSVFVRTSGKVRRLAAFGIGLSPFILGPWGLYMATVSWPLWPGYVKGIEISVLDAVAIAVLVALPRRRTSAVVPVILASYAAISLLSGLLTTLPVASTFYAWQLLRMVVVLLAVTRLCANEDARALDIVFGLSVGLLIQAGYALNGYLNGEVQAAGQFGHQNLLGMMSHFVTFPALALLLGKQPKTFAYAGVLAAAIVAITGASRGTIGALAIGIVLLLALSLLRSTSPRKIAIAGGLVGMLAVAAPIALYTLDKRFEEKPLSADYDERAAFVKSAELMLADYPLGVGANQYVVVANTRGYSERGGVVPTQGSRSANVHQTYLLAAAETGYLGALSLILLLGASAALPLRAAWRHRRDPRGELLVGASVAVLIVAIQSLYEWVLLTFNVQYLLVIVTGMALGVARALRYSSSERVTARRLPLVGSAELIVKT